MAIFRPYQPSRLATYDGLCNLFAFRIIINFNIQGYHFGVVKLEVKSKTSTGLEFTCGGTSNDAGVVSSFVLDVEFSYVTHAGITTRGIPFNFMSWTAPPPISPSFG